ncbi:DUF3822 family protein [Saccharicrinis sp. FJH62]|uniref:DUF3822 family protein n=1 Tax=Saccharicrinis sp. FJH62 TaxID=3344657 RepID=UPI0035D4DC77
MHDILVLSPVFNQESSKQYILSIQLCLDGFSFLICDSISNKFIYLKHKPYGSDSEITDQTLKYLKTEELLNLNYKKVIVLYDLSPATCIPQVLFEDEEKEVFYTKNYRKGKSSIVRSDKQDPLNYVSVYAINETILNAMNQQFGTPVIIHNNTIKNCHLLSTSESFVKLTIRQNRFSISAYKNNTLILANSYSYQNDDEFLYFFLYCFNQLKLDQMKTVVEIDGIIPKHASLVKQLERFIKNVTFAGWPEAYNFANDFYDLPAHYFTNLYSSLLCE